MPYKKERLILDFTTGNVPKQLIFFATPLFLSNLLQVVYNAVDMIIVGHFLGESGLSAVSIGGDISHFLTFLAMGFSSAGQIILSQYIGAKKEDEIGKFIATLFTALFCCAVVLSVFSLMLREAVLFAMNTPPDAYGGAFDYTTVSVIGLIFVYGYNACSAILRGLGNSIYPFIFISIAALLNLVLDILFVAVLPWGCMGAALATVISQGTSFLFCLRFLYKRKNELGIEFSISFFRNVDMAMLRNLVGLGVPMAIKGASIQFSRLFVNSWVNSYGVSVSAFSGVANKINSIANLVSNSAGTAGSSMVGQNIAAKEYKRVTKIIGAVSGITLFVASVMSIVILCFPKNVFALFFDDQLPLYIVYEYLPVAVLYFFGSATRAPMNALLNGSGNHKVNFATAILDGIVMRIGLSPLFGITFGMGYLGFWLGDALAGFTPFFIGIFFYFWGGWKTGQK